MQRRGHEGDDIVAVGQRQAIAAPEDAHGRTHLSGPLAGAGAAQHLAAAHVVYRHYACAHDNHP